jgi:hypothetical protein
MYGLVYVTFVKFDLIYANLIKIILFNLIYVSLAKFTLNQLCKTKNWLQFSSNKLCNASRLMSLPNAKNGQRHNHA